MKYINGLGIEIEGGWNRKLLTAAVKHDGSVKNCDTDYVGEVASRVITNIEEVEKWIIENYPDETNETCGLHIHMSFKSISHYSSLLDSEDFYRYFLDQIEEWAKEKIPNDANFWNRIRGNNIYCRREWYPEEQIINSEKGNVRRCHWNFCYSLFNTAECRLFPAFTSVQTSIDAIKKLINIVERYLENVKTLEIEGLEEIEDISF